MTWAEAKAAGALSESETWMIRYRVHGVEEAKKILRQCRTPPTTTRRTSHGSTR